MAQDNNLTSMVGGGFSNRPEGWGSLLGGVIGGAVKNVAVRKEQERAQEPLLNSRIALARNAGFGDKIDEIISQNQNTKEEHMKNYLIDNKKKIIGSYTDLLSNRGQSAKDPAIIKQAQDFYNSLLTKSPDEALQNISNATTIKREELNKDSIKYIQNKNKELFRQLHETLPSYEELIQLGSMQPRQQGGGRPQMPPEVVSRFKLVDQILKRATTEMRDLNPQEKQAIDKAYKRIAALGYGEVIPPAPPVTASAEEKQGFFARTINWIGKNVFGSGEQSQQRDSLNLYGE